MDSEDTEPEFEEAPQPAPHLPIPLEEVIGGYWRNNSSRRCCSVIFNQKKQQGQPRPPPLQRWLFHNVHKNSDIALLLKKSTTCSRLVQQLEQAVSQLQDKEVDSNFRQVQPADQKAADQQPVLSWLENVKLTRVAATGPGHRAYSPSAAQQVLAVVPRRDFAAGELIGFYLGEQTGTLPKPAPQLV
jgi:hypothetical protein